MPCSVVVSCSKRTFNKTFIWLWAQITKEIFIKKLLSPRFVTYQNGNRQQRLESLKIKWRRCILLEKICGILWWELRHWKSKENLRREEIWRSCWYAYPLQQVCKFMYAQPATRRKLESHFQKKSLSHKIFYRRKLYSTRMEEGTSMIDHVNYIKSLSACLGAVDDAVSEKDLVIILISSPSWGIQLW